MSQSGSSTQQPTSSAVVPTTTASTQLVLPTDKTLQQACKLSLKTKKPI